MKPSDDNIKYRHLIEHMNEAVWIGDEKERTVYANPKFCELMECDLSEIL
jgi:PAS domain S-box-containing protein